MTEKELPFIEAGEGKKEALRRDYEHLMDTTRIVGLPVPREFVSVARRNQREEVLHQVRADGLLVMSGPSRLGKTSEINMIFAELKRNGGQPLFIDCNGFGEASGIERSILRMAKSEGLQAQNSSEIIATLKEKDAIVCIDELTGVIDGSYDNEERYTIVRDFISRVRDAGVPLIVVVHAFPFIWEKIKELEWQQLLDATMMIPDFLTDEEIVKISRYGSVYPAGTDLDRLAEPEVYRGAANNEVIAEIKRLFGRWPININAFFQAFANTQQASPSVEQLDTGQLRQVLQAGLWEHMTTRYQDNASRSVYNVLKNEELIDRFSEAFGITKADRITFTSQPFRARKDIVGKVLLEVLHNLRFIKEADNETVEIDSVLFSSSMQKLLLS